MRPHPINMLAIAAMLAACNAAPGVSPSPTATPPTASPAPTGTPAPSPSPTFSAEQIQHPTGATEIVLRMEQGGGFVPIDFMVTQAPQFTLYGDGTVVWRGAQDGGQLGVGGAFPPFNAGKMSEEAIQALLAFALGTGRLANARDTYNNDMCADCPTTIFNLNAGGVEKVVSIYALSEAQPGGPDAVDRHGFVQLADLLGNFDAEAQSGTVDEIKAYDPELYKATMFEGMGEPVGLPIAWPWDDLKLTDFPKGDEPGAVKMITREQVAKLTDVPNGGQMSIWVTAPDDSLVQFGIRPLLPDEIAAFQAS